MLWLSFNFFCVVLFQNPNWVRSYFTFFSFPDELVSNLNIFSPAYFSTHFFDFFSTGARAAMCSFASFFPAPLAGTDNATALICVFAPPTTSALRFFVVVLREYSGSRPSERSYTMHTSTYSRRAGHRQRRSAVVVNSFATTSSASDKNIFHSFSLE